MSTYLAKTGEVERSWYVIDAAGKPAFYDRVARNYIYPIGDKAEFVAEFTGTATTRDGRILNGRRQAAGL